jgi:hypothetical protein
MENNFYLTTSDLILCFNLLVEDAREWEMSHKETGAYSYAKDRKELAKKIENEIERRDKAFLEYINPKDEKVGQK